MIKPIQTSNSPAAIGPYSQAIEANGMIYLSGQIPLDPASMEVVEGGIRNQTLQVFKNLTAVAEAAGSSLQNAVKLTIYLVDLSNFGEVNEIMAAQFEQPFPARATVEVSALPKGVAIEIDAILAL